MPGGSLLSSVQSLPRLILPEGSKKRGLFKLNENKCMRFEEKEGISAGTVSHFFFPREVPVLLPASPAVLSVKREPIKAFCQCAASLASLLVHVVKSAENWICSSQGASGEFCGNSEFLWFRNDRSALEAQADIWWLPLAGDFLHVQALSQVRRAWGLRLLHPCVRSQ